ncbi:MAG: DNA-3-methyladenine glycosylase I, partial [Bacteroidetes bacterium]|nr:DNA-3-methyladenine glycosylase I [Bacteroidota bacterium]
MSKEKNRCGWCLKDELYISYHDTEWGVPVYDDLRMFEFLILETFQAGLSWHIILKKRENFRKAFHDFSPEKMAGMGEKDVLNLLQNEGIVRNKMKINGAIKNAQAFLEIVETNQSFCDYMWQFTGGVPLVNAHKTLSELPSSTAQ